MIVNCRTRIRTGYAVADTEARGWPGTVRPVDVSYLGANIIVSWPSSQSFV